MKRITPRQVKVFAMFCVAFLLTGLAYAYAGLGDTPLALVMGATAAAFIAGIFLEARTA